MIVPNHDEGAPGPSSSAAEDRDIDRMRVLDSVQAPDTTRQFLLAGNGAKENSEATENPGIAGVFNLKKPRSERGSAIAGTGAAMLAAAGTAATAGWAAGAAWVWARGEPVDEVVGRPGARDLHLALAHDGAGGGELVLVALNVLAVDEVGDIQDHFAAFGESAAYLFIERQEEAVHLEADGTGPVWRSRWRLALSRSC